MSLLASGQPSDGRQRQAIEVVSWDGQTWRSKPTGVTVEPMRGYSGPGLSVDRSGRLWLGGLIRPGDDARSPPIAALQRSATTGHQSSHRRPPAT